MLAAIRVLNRLELVGETLRHALNSLAVVAPDWLRAQVSPEWFDRYGARVENYRLPKTAAAREALAATIGADGRQLLQAVEAATDLPWLREVQAVQTLRQVWTEQYTDPPGPLRWRAVHERVSAAVLIASPYDPEARYSTKREVQWVGYKVHLTETCDDGQPISSPRCITTPATTPDCVMGPAIHQDLANAISSPARTCSTAATWMPSCWSPPRPNIRSTWSARPLAPIATNGWRVKGMT